MRLSLTKAYSQKTFVCFFGLLATAFSFANQPNFIVIITDDLGYGDLSCYGRTEFSTPELDRMAAEGMRFTDFYAAHFICSPSRAGLLTGRHSARFGINGIFRNASTKGLPSDEFTIAEMLSEQGYATAAIGKWHLGHLPEFLPTEHGFDYYYGFPLSNNLPQDGGMPVAEDVVFREGMTLKDYRSYQPHSHGPEADESRYSMFKNKPAMVRGKEVIEWPADHTLITQRFTEETVAFIENHKDEPFFIYLAHSMPHLPLHTSAAFDGYTDYGLYGDVISEIDWSVGQILKTLRDLNLDRNTLVVFTSDNGPIVKAKAGSAGDLRGGKGTSYEGGHRVPGIFWWPDTIPEGVVTERVISAFDLMPTMAANTSTVLPSDRAYDGTDITTIITNADPVLSDKEEFLYGRGEGIRIGEWKFRDSTLKRGGKGREADNPRVQQLFNLNDDAGEHNNLIKEYPEKALAMQKRLEQEWQTIENDD